MPTYDYACDANGKVVEVRHRMSELLSTWGDVCEASGLPPGDTPADTPVRRLATGGQVVKSSSLHDSLPPCASGSCCGGAMCGID